MKEIRFNQFMLRVKTAWKILTNPKHAWVLISLEKRDLRAMIAGEDFDIGLVWHKLQPYTMYKLIDSTMVDPEDLILMKAEFQAESELYYKKSDKRERL